MQAKLNPHTYLESNERNLEEREVRMNLSSPKSGSLSAFACGNQRSLKSSAFRGKLWS